MDTTSAGVHHALKGRGVAAAMTGALPPGEIEPIAVRLNEAQRLSGFSRSDLYRRASRGEIIFLKSGSRILVEFASLKAAIAALPIARINIAV
jgi:hypothetical protein